MRGETDGERQEADGKRCCCFLLNQLDPGRGFIGIAAILLIVLHLVLVGCMAFTMSPTVDEYAHLAAGVCYWRTGRFDLYRVNPPLVRLVVALPVVIINQPAVDWQHYPRSSDRTEWDVGQDYVLTNGVDKALNDLHLARIGGLVFTVLGAIICRRWACELYGPWPGLAALCLWCVSPHVLAFAAVITSDVAAAALGLSASYLFWKWLTKPHWNTALAAGTVLGLAELAKSTWICLYFLWPLVICLTRWQLVRTPMRQFAAIIALSFVVVNAGYGFEKTWQPLGIYQFESSAFTDQMPRLNGGDGGNRFRETWLASVPVPLPMNYVCGIDVQKADFERGRWCYLAGEWKFGGWWYWYLFAAALRIPIGTWVLGAMAVASRTCWTSTSDVEVESRSLARYILCGTVGVIVVFASSQASIPFFRYLLPAFPFAYVGLSALFQLQPAVGIVRTFLPWTLIVWNAVSCLLAAPGFMSYYNEIAGSAGPQLIFDDTLDWGQAAGAVKSWLSQHPHAAPVWIACTEVVPWQSEGDGKSSNQDGIVWRSRVVGDLAHQSRPQAGWTVISTFQLHRRDGRYAYLLRQQPIERISNFIEVFHLNQDDVIRIEHERRMTQ